MFQLMRPHSQSIHRAIVDQVRAASNHWIQLMLLEQPTRLVRRYTLEGKADGVVKLLTIGTAIAP
jgi:hypothetical protein